MPTDKCYLCNKESGQHYDKVIFYGREKSVCGTCKEIIRKNKFDFDESKTLFEEVKQNEIIEIQIVE